MTDIPKTPETAPDPTTDETPAASAATAAPAPQPEPGLADTARLLGEHFPALFGAGVIKPVKLRIQADIHQRAPGVFTRKALSIFLHRHTTGTAYLRALVAEAATRIDLDGQPAGEIAAEHREAAAAELERRRAIVEAKKQAGRDAARAARRDTRPPRPPVPPLPPEHAQASQSSSAATGEPPVPRGAGSVRSGAAGRPDRAPRSSEQRQPPRRQPWPRPERKPASAHDQEPVNAPAQPLTPEQAAEAEARRQRAMLLRSFEQSPLSKANFGALKGLGEEALDALLAVARQERSSR